MASELSTLLQSSHSTDEFEGLEVTEFDPNTLRELLYELEEELGSDAAVPPVQSMEGVGIDHGFSSDDHQCANHVEVDMMNLNWFEMVNEVSPCNETGAWYGGTCNVELEMNEVFEMEDYLPSFGAVVSEDIGYIGLWPED